MQKIVDSVTLRAVWQLLKWKDSDGRVSAFLQNGGSIEEARKLFGEPFGVEEMKGNLALNEGLQELIDIICAIGSPTKWDNTNARLGVGDSNTAAAATQTGLQAATNKTFKAMDATYPQKSNQTVEWRSTFASADANYPWEEYTIVNAADDTGKNLNRKVESKGTKVSGESWTLSLKITFS